MKIRRAEKKGEDINSIFQIISNAASAGKILPRAKKEIEEVIGSFFVAETDGKIAGCCCLEIYNKKLAEIRSLAVLPEFQSRGLGKRLVDACIKRAKDEGIYEILTISDKDVFFEKSGFGKCLNGQWALFMKLK